MSDALPDRLLAAHRDGASAELSCLYTQAADRREAEGDADAAGFYLTHAYVFALEAGLDARAIHMKLKETGREE